MNSLQNKLSDKANEIFKRSGIKSLGDLIDNELTHLPGIEKFPGSLKTHSLDPNEVFTLPNYYYYEGQRNGVPERTLIDVAEKASEFKLRVMTEAVNALKPAGI